MKKFVPLLFSLCFICQVGLAQNTEKNLIQENLIPSLSSERFLSNTKVKKNGIDIQPIILKDKNNWDEKRFSIEIKKDSIKWEVTDQQGELYQISYPNDYSLFFGKDKKILQDELIKRLITNQPAKEEVSLTTFSLDSLASILLQKKLNHKSDSLYGSNAREKLIADSLVNLFKFPTEQDPPFLFDLSFHKYGNTSVEFKIDKKEFLNAILQNETWEIWGASKDDLVLLLFEHPFLNFQHMLALNLDFENGRIKGEFYSYIPNTNFVELSSSYKEKEKLFKLNIDN